MAAKIAFSNPFRPGAGHPPPFLAGRKAEIAEFEQLLKQTSILQNTVLTGLRGVGKTVLLEASFKPQAIRAGWLWVGTDLSETASLTEENVATRLLTDLAVVTAAFEVGSRAMQPIGFGAPSQDLPIRLDYATLTSIFGSTPGLVSDKVKRVLEIVNIALPKNYRGIVFAYDEAQNLADHASDKQYPLSMLLDLFQSIQRKGVPFMLVLTGLPTLFPKLVVARTYSERMFHVLFLNKLSESESREAIHKPIAEARCPVHFAPEAVDAIVKLSGGYPYFIQFICRETFDVFLQNQEAPVPVADIIRKLDSDFFAGRWARVTDRQRDLLWVVATLPHSDQEFTVQEVVEQSKVSLSKCPGSSQVNQILAALTHAGLIYKNRHGKYSFAVPLFGQFIARQAPPPGAKAPPPPPFVQPA